MLVFYSPADHEADRPTLIECIRFQGRERIINIPQEIDTSYDDFGLLLLDDHNGRRIHFIARNIKMMLSKSTKRSSKSGLLAEASIQSHGRH